MTTTRLGPREALIDALDWAAGQDVRNRLNLPSEWNQAQWLTERPGAALGGHCGTAGCIAGYVTLNLAGATPRKWAEGISSNVTLPDGSEASVRTVAQDFLGLSFQQAAVLFDESNDLDDLVDIASQILDGQQTVVRSRDGFGEES